MDPGGLRFPAARLPEAAMPGSHDHQVYSQSATSEGRTAEGVGPEQGFVSLIGAGPGNPDLITVRGLKVLQAAQVVLYDALLDPAFADLFPDRALALPVGKRCGKASVGQDDIHRLMIEHARAGRRVARLKGGDPLVYGRGGEEALALEAAGVPFEVIPGVSALQAAAAGAGFPLTHRQVSRRITVLEGHHLPDSPADWRDLATSGGTLAVYMGTRTIQALARALLDHGAAPDLPVALVEQAQCPGQTSTFSTLAHAAAGALRPATTGPGLLVIGEVLHHRFHPASEIPHEPAALVSGSSREARPRGGRRERRAS
jgi:uroporphyrin-III C-methyltransferase